MIITRPNLEALRVGFSTAFMEGMGMAAPQWDRVATRVGSTTGENRYGWLKELPGMREWIGDRVINGLAEADYSIRNKDWEQTIGVDRNDIEDDTLGTYSTRFQAMGQATAAQPDIMVWGLLKAGFSTPCYDGQFFFDEDHPVLDANGVAQSVSNDGGGSGTPWFLLATNGFLKPLIYQERKAPVFTSLDSANDENVFMKKQFLYGVDMRANVGFGLWQMAYGSQQTLNAAAYATARANIMGRTGDYGRPLGLVPNLLVVPPSLESAGRKILNSEYAAGGETNEWKGTAELLVVPWLA